MRLSGVDSLRRWRRIDLARLSAMGFLRKATWVATGGASGLVVKANSKKERTAKALEQQNRLMKQQLKLARQTAPSESSGNADPISPSPDMLEERSELRYARRGLSNAESRYRSAEQKAKRLRNPTKKAAAEGAKASAWADVEAAQRKLDEGFPQVLSQSTAQSPPLSSLWASQPQALPPPPASSMGISAPSLTAELEQLAALHRDGSLSDAEFQAAKSRII